MATQVIRATTKTIRSIDKTLSLVQQSESRMDALNKRKRES
jgi:hypothetical protein